MTKSLLVRFRYRRRARKRKRKRAVAPTTRYRGNHVPRHITPNYGRRQKACVKIQRACVTATGKSVNVTAGSEIAVLEQGTLAAPLFLLQSPPRCVAAFLVPVRT
ncbi:hypothetical protein V5799_032051 [Amblyomma americanum]|uniref:Uncharacterized protein n=1 Tax=Amblyomma americanum TaxID=6943 RepID=A0AAQ4DS98_AMBAM